MANKVLYQLSGRQILVLALASALIAAAAVAGFYGIGSIDWRGNSLTNTAQAEQGAPRGISDPSAVSDEQNNIEVYRTISPGVVFITTSTVRMDFSGQESEQEEGSGSGSIIDNQGHILTNYHVIESAIGGREKLTVKIGGDKTYPATIVGGDPDTDLAVIKIEPPREGLTIVPFGDSDQLTVGQKVLAIGNPFGLDRTLTTGVISGLQRPIRARNGRPIDAAIQTDASINPGNSGGPLLDKFGKIIGINSQILSPAGGSVGVGFAIPVGTAKRIVPQLIQYGEVRRPKLGAYLVSVNQLNQQGADLPVSSGLLVRSVANGSAAQRSGLRGLSQDNYGNVALGDIITTIDGEKMNDVDDLFRYLDKKQVGDTVQVEVIRSGKREVVPIKLIALPSTGQGRTIR